MTDSQSDIKPLLNEHDVARLLKLSVATVRRRRLLRQPPEFVKLGAAVRYHPSAIQRLIENAEKAAQEVR
jgi:predicted DNA-binding transcriptional regulator AlpA